MPQNMTSLLSYAFLFIVFYLTYTAYDWKKKIWCSFRRADRTKIEKWAKVSEKRIEFDGGWYHVEPSRATLMWKMVLGFFPMPARSLDFRHDSPRALSPDDFSNDFTPEARKQMDTADEVRGMSEGHMKALGSKKKGGLLSDYMPIILVVGLLVLGFMMYQQQKRMDMLGQAINVLQQMIMR